MQSCRNKAIELNEVIIDHNIDIMCIVESWLKENGDETVMHELTPPGYKISSFPRKSRKGGGLAIIHRDIIRPTIKCHETTHLYQTFESAEILINCPEKTTKIIVLYRPPKSTKNTSSSIDFIN